MPVMRTRNIMSEDSMLWYFKKPLFFTHSRKADWPTAHRHSFSRVGPNGQYRYDSQKYYRRKYIITYLIKLRRLYAGRTYGSFRLYFCCRRRRRYNALDRGYPANNVSIIFLWAYDLRSRFVCCATVRSPRFSKLESNTIVLCPI